MNYTHTESNRQLAFSETKYSFLSIPSRLEGFNNSDTTVSRSVSDREVFCFNGELELAESDRICPVCGGRMHINGHRELVLRHLCFDSNLSAVRFDRVQLVRRVKNLYQQENVGDKTFLLSAEIFGTLQRVKRVEPK